MISELFENRSRAQAGELSEPLFGRYIGIDYSGAETPESSLKGLRVYSSTPSQEPVEILPPPGLRKYWSRRGLSEWLVGELRAGPPTLVGIDHAFSFPLRYFETHWIPPEWRTFLEDFSQHWPTAEAHVYVDFVRDGLRGQGALRSGNSRWRRRCEERSGAKSVFHFDVPGSVAKSTHAGLPWLLYYAAVLGQKIHFWPFDGCVPPSGCSVMAEVYPSLWKQAYPREGRTPDQHDAYTVARWMREADQEGKLAGYFDLAMSPAGKLLVEAEGWILGLGAE